MGFNFAANRADHDQYESLPTWARESLEALADAPPVGSVHAVFPSRRGLSPAVRHFLDFLGETLPGRSSQATRELQQAR